MNTFWKVFLTITARKLSLVLCLIILGLVGTAADASLPGYKMAPPAFPVSPRDAKRILDERVVKATAPRGIEILSPTEATSEIQALARALKNDVDLIYQYVHDHIEYTPIFGCVKDATATIADGKGNDFDQASLMIALLRQAGYDANYVFGELDLTYSELSNWVGPTSVLDAACIPRSGYDPNHVWVKVNIEGTDYVFDPSFKTHSYIDQIDLASAMGYDQGSFLSSALSGYTAETDYIQNVNTSNIEAALTGYATNLIGYIKTNHSDATLSAIIGGKTINPVEGTPLRQTSLPNQKSIMDEWAEIPDQYKHSLQITYRGIDETFYSCDIYGKRLTIFFNASNEPVLRLDGTDIATGDVTTPGYWYPVGLTIDHPYAASGGTYLDASSSSWIKGGSAGFIMNGWGTTGPGMIERHREILAENDHAGGDNTSEPVLGESLSMVAYTWLAESSRINELAHQITDTRVHVINHHAVGVCGQADSPIIDIPLSMNAYATSGSTDKAKACYFSLSGHRSALEWGVIDQLQPYSAVSTVKLIGISNDKSDKIFEVTGGGQIYVSSDSGNTWTPKESNRKWRSVAVSDDGTRQTAVVSGGKIYVSTDAGDTWTPKESDRDWSSVAMSADGTRQTAVVSGGQIYVSADSGNTWTPKESDREWTSVAMSNTGERQTAVAEDGDDIYVSVDYGSTWTPFGLEGDWTSVAMSADATIQTAVGWYTQIYVTHDSWQTWTAAGPADEEWRSVAMSADGTRQAAVAWNSQIYISTDSGVTWETKDSNRDWTSVAMSADGSLLTAVVSGGRIYVSTNSGDTWAPKDSDRDWSSVAMSADGSLQTAVENNYFKTTIEPQLINYSSSELSAVRSYLNSGRRVILPEDGDLREEDWEGTGFLAINPSESSMAYVIKGDLNGGFGSRASLLEGIDTRCESCRSRKHCKTAKPIDLVTGAHLYEKTDLTIGSFPFPIGLDLRRFYNSGARLDDGPLGLGWTHNLDITAGQDSDGFQGLGRDSPVDAAAAIVEQYVCIDILTGTGTKTIERLVIATLTERWVMEQLIDNVVKVREPDVTSKFVKLPDGSYNPAPGQASVLTEEEDGSYLLRTKHGAEFDFDPEGRLATWKDPNSNTVTLSYSDGKLQTVANDFNRALTFTYDGEYLSELLDGSGRIVGYSYDGSGNLIAVTDPNGDATTFEYDMDGRLTRIYLPANPTDPYVTKTYDSTGRVATRADAAGNTFDYYIAGFRAEEVNPLGDSYILYFNDQGSPILDTCACAAGSLTTYAYDGHDRLVLKTFAEGNSEVYEYDENHNVTIETMYPKPGSVESPIVSLYTYEPTFNKLETFTDPLERTTTFTYDSKGNLTTIEQPEVSGQTPQTILTYNSHGQVETITDPEGMTTGFTYDETTGGPLSTVVDQGTLNLTTQYTYDNLGNPTDITNPLGHTTTFQYDAMRRLVQTITPSPLNYFSKYTYDPDGKLIKVEKQSDDIQNPWQTTTTTYTLSGNIESFIDPQGHVTTHLYDQADRLWKVTNAEDQTTEYLYDPLGRIHQVIDSLGNVSEEYTYTMNGQGESLKDANGNKTDYEYDDFDRPSKITYPDASFVVFTYDAAGNLTERRTRSGATLEYEYNNLNRRTLKRLPGPEQTLYNYDLTGRLTDVTDLHGTIHHDFDTAGRLASVTYPGSKTVAYEYDDTGNRIKLTYPGGYYVTYAYDALDRLTAVLESGITPLSQYQYDPLSRRTVLGYANGTSSNYTYEIDNDLAEVSHQFNGNRVSFIYSYDDVGNRISTTVDDDSYLFSPAASTDIDYVSNELNQYTSVDSIPFSYDGSGNLTSDGINSYTYDAESLLIAATSPTHSATYTYNPFGWRTGKTVNGVSTFYLHDEDQVIAEYNESNQVLRRYVYGPGIDQPICMIAGGSVHHYHFDGLGSVTALSDDSGDEIETYAYSPYGKVNQTSSMGNPYLYTGREYDGETGLYYYRARHYDPEIGRFIQVDPIGPAGGMNLYEYVSGNPLRYSDPLGLGWLDSFKKWIKKKASNFDITGGVVPKVAEGVIKDPTQKEEAIKTYREKFGGCAAERQRKVLTHVYETCGAKVILENTGGPGSWIAGATVKAGDVAQGKKTALQAAGEVAVSVTATGIVPASPKVPAAAREVISQGVPAADAIYSTAKERIGAE